MWPYQALQRAIRSKLNSRGVLVVLVVVVVLVVLVVFVGSRRSLAGLESSGRPVGRISTWWRPQKLPWSRVMTKKNELHDYLHHDYCHVSVLSCTMSEKCR